MSITGQVGHVAFATQPLSGDNTVSASGSPVTDAAKYSAVKVTGDSLVSNNNPLAAEGEIGLGRDVSQMIPGGYSAAGAVNGNLRARAADIFLEGALGKKDIRGHATRYAVGNDLPWWSVLKKIGSTSTSTPVEQILLRYQDAMVNTLNISIPSGGLSTFSAGLIAAGETRIKPVSQGGLSATSGSNSENAFVPSYNAQSDDLLVFHGGRIFNGATGGAIAKDETFQSIEIAINNNIAADEYTVRPSRFLRSLTEGIRSVEVNMTLVFEDQDKYSRYTYGAANNTQPGYSFYLGALQVLVANWQLTDVGAGATPVDAVGYSAGSFIGATPFLGATPGYTDGVANGSDTSINPQAVQFNIPKLAFTGLPVALASGRIVVTTSARALKTAGGEDIITAFVRPRVGPGQSPSVAYDAAANTRYV